MKVLHLFHFVSRTAGHSFCFNSILQINWEAKQKQHIPRFLAEQIGWIIGSCFCSGPNHVLFKTRLWIRIMNWWYEMKLWLLINFEVIRKEFLKSVVSWKCPNPFLIPLLKADQGQQTSRRAVKARGVKVDNNIPTAANQLQKILGVSIVCSQVSCWIKTVLCFSIMNVTKWTAVWQWSSGNSNWFTSEEEKRRHSHC